MAAERPPSGGAWHPPAPSPVPNPPRPTPQPPAATAPTPQTGQPLTAGGGSPISKYSWALALVQALGGTPTPQIVNLLVAWIDKEGTAAAWNPLAITGKASGSTQFNSIGVQNFTSFQQGVQATAQFLQNGRYNDIVAAIRSGNVALALDAPQEFDTWGGSKPGAYSSSLFGIYRTVSGDPTAGQASLRAAQSGGQGPTSAASGSAASYILSTDPSLEWALGVPELASILNQAATGNWNDTQLTAALMNSDYYRSNSAQVRAWQALQQSDPSSAARDIQQAEANLKAQAASLGITISDSALAGLALGDQEFQWNADEERQHLLAASAFSQSGALGTGAVGDGATQAKQLFAQYGIDLPDNLAQQYGLQINTATDPTSALENLRPLAINQAKGMFPTLAPLLDQGVTVAQVFSPYANAASNLLGVDPSQINLADPKWNRALQGDGKQGQMSLQQWQSTVMTDPQYHYDSSENGQASAVNLTQSLGRVFGVST